MFPWSYTEMCAPTSQASPSRTSAYACWREARPSRSDFTSVPDSTRPASIRSSRWYSCRARRLSTISFSPPDFAMRASLDAASLAVYNPGSAVRARGQLLRWQYLRTTVAVGCLAGYGTASFLAPATATAQPAGQLDDPEPTPTTTTTPTPDPAPAPAPKPA